jgi:hypothetical protein
LNEAEKTAIRRSFLCLPTNREQRTSFFQQPIAKETAEGKFEMLLAKKCPGALIKGMELGAWNDAKRIAPGPHPNQSRYVGIEKCGAMWTGYSMARFPEGAIGLLEEKLVNLNLGEKRAR